MTSFNCFCNHKSSQQVDLLLQQVDMSSQQVDMSSQQVDLLLQAAYKLRMILIMSKSQFVVTTCRLVTNEMMVFYASFVHIV